MATLTAAVVTLLAARRRGPGRRVWLLPGLGLLGDAGGLVIQFRFAAGQPRHDPAPAARAAAWPRPLAGGSELLSPLPAR